MAYEGGARCTRAGRDIKWLARCGCVVLKSVAIRKESLENCRLRRLAIVKCLYRLARGQTAEHEVDRTDANHRFARIRAPFVVLAVSSIAPHPSVGAFHDPTLGQFHEALRSLRSRDDFEIPAGTVLA